MVAFACTTSGELKACPAGALCESPEIFCKADTCTFTAIVKLLVMLLSEPGRAAFTVTVPTALAESVAVVEAKPDEFVVLDAALRVAAPEGETVQLTVWPEIGLSPEASVTLTTSGCVAWPALMV